MPRAFPEIIDRSPSGESRSYATLDPHLLWVSDKQAAKAIGISPATLWRWLKRYPDFPKPAKLSPGCSRFNLGQIYDYVAARVVGK